MLAVVAIDSFVTNLCKYSELLHSEPRVRMLALALEQLLLG